ncbi:L,D-transpeptidase family protein [Streptomyces boncukensis]|uniref:Murein L,D-transpeptidase n=1 Tax=Streptomyces boncukensis TaxID=2711219 RepID=A0A6G4X5L4_9ACTN|nr:L,D-transpeptidase family protein [Streptomyces boncukensis]NGO72826.1 murein L,D-transpeptidase [Streptomyces boncukensis]
MRPLHGHLPIRRGRTLQSLTLALLLSLPAGVATAATPADRTAPAAPAECRAGTGPYQRQLERHLKLPVDGRQSAADCRAIRAFQKRQSIPATGKADVVTYRTALVQEARTSPRFRTRCPRRTYRVVCVDLAHQVLWVHKGRARKLEFKPVGVRTGRLGMETRHGWHRIYWRNRNHRSTLYNNEPMPYAQFFDGGQALHGSYRDLYRGGSAGCVNLRIPDAARLWRLLRKGDRLYVFGIKPGTNYRALPLPLPTTA